MIERVFHHVWIGKDGAPLPTEFVRYRQTWIDRHPYWAFKLWNLDNLDFRPLRPELFARCRSPAQVADLLRMEVLYRHGGVYVDTDFECFRPIEPLIRNADYLFCSENGAVISTGFIGAARGAELIRRLIENFPADLGRQLPNVETGPAFVTGQLLRFGLHGRVTLVPSAALYPYAMGEPRVDAAGAPEAYGAHHWAHSWAAPKPPWLRRASRRLIRLQTRFRAALRA